MKIVADTVFADEPCYSLFEGPHRVSGLNGEQGVHLVQRVFVVRGDCLAEWTHDFGPIENFPDATHIIIPSFGENSVAQLQEEAERSRCSPFAKKHREKVAAESTLMSDIVRQIEARSQVVKNRSVLGPTFNVQRNDYSSVRTQRKLKEKSKHV